MASKKTNLVISYSLYHLWLDFQLPIDGSENDLILIGDFPEIESLYSSAKSVLKKRFQRILILPGVHSSRNKFLFKIQNLRNSQKIRSFLTKKHYHNLFFHHDKRLETQTAIHIAEKNNVNVISNFVEDGLAHYIDERIPPNAFRERFLKTIFPSYWEVVLRLGTHSKIKQYYFTQPDRVFEEYKKKTCHKLEVDNISDFEKLAREYISCVYPKLLEQKITQLFILPYFSKLDELSSLIHNSRLKADSGLYLKLHPKNAHFSPALVKLNHQTIPTALSAEMLMALWPNLELLLYKDNTCVLSAPYLLKNPQILYV